MVRPVYIFKRGTPMVRLPKEDQILFELGKAGFVDEF